ncbi:MAG: plastocyanin/azurin family copper-binding protein [Haloarculaceae archaeon]
MKRRAYLATAVGASAMLAGCSLGSASQDDYDVGMTAMSFRPEETTASVGDTVVWRNTSSRGHTVTAYENGIPDGAAYFASGGYETESAAREAWRTGGDGTIPGDATFEHTFEVAGTYHYFCIPHESRGMVGRVVVSE